MEQSEREEGAQGAYAFSTLHNRNRAELITFGAHLLGDRAAAEDIVQEAFLKLSSDLDRVRAPEQWLRTLVYRRCLNEIRRRKRQEAVHTRFARDPTRKTAVDVTAEQDRELAAALSGLSPNQRGAVLLCWGEGRSSGEAAAILGCSPATIRVHLHRARRALSKELQHLDPSREAPGKSR